MMQPNTLLPRKFSVSDTRRCSHSNHHHVLKVTWKAFLKYSVVVARRGLLSPSPLPHGPSAPKQRQRLPQCIHLQLNPSPVMTPACPKLRESTTPPRQMLILLVKLHWQTVLLKLCQLVTPGLLINHRKNVCLSRKSRVQFRTSLCPSAKL